MSPWEYYLMVSRRAEERFGCRRVLKIDARNEGVGLPVRGGIAGNLASRNVTILECDRDAIAKAKTVLPGINYVSGDIRALPFADNSFDLILDLSTIDHIPESDVSLALSEYARVAPVLVLVAWCSGDLELVRMRNAVPWRPENQYLFFREKLLLDIQKFFSILESDVSFHFDGSNYLSYDLCQRRV